MKKVIGGLLGWLGASLVCYGAWLLAPWLGVMLAGFWLLCITAAIHEQLKQPRPGALPGPPGSPSCSTSVHGDGVTTLTTAWLGPRPGERHKC